MNQGIIVLTITAVVAASLTNALECQKSSGVTSSTPDPDYPRDCADVIALDGCASSGVYQIYPDGFTSSGFEAYCDMDTTGGGWTVFQRRECGCIDFYRGWEDYKEGFGCLNSEHWLGNDYIHALTNHTDRRMTLRVDLSDWSCPAVSRFAEYETFTLHAETEKYAMHVTAYSGNAGDALTHHSGAAFSTKDQDNDVHAAHCAVSYKGAWWYKSCHHANLNGLYHTEGVTTEYANTVVWNMWKGYYYSMKKTSLKVRPKEYWARDLSNNDS